jgi:hypothetical protein
MAFDLYSLLARVSVPLAVFVAIGLARKYFPVARSVSPDRSMANDEHFASINLMINAYMVVVGVLLVWAIHSLLTASNLFFAGLGGPVHFCLLPQTAIWWFLPGFAALTLSWDITLFLWTFIAGRTLVDSYRHWTNLKAGYDCTKTLRILAVLIVLPIAVATALAVPMHANLYENEIRVRAYASAHDQIFRYSDARKLTQIKGFRGRDGKLTKRAGIVIDFVDGRRWSSADYGNFRPTVERGLANFLRLKTNLTLEYAEAESDILR